MIQPTVSGAERYNPLVLPDIHAVSGLGSGLVVENRTTLEYLC